MILGYEAFRRKTIADFPDETWESAGPRWRERVSGLRSHAPGGSGGEGKADPAEERIAQLERLKDLHTSGVLSDEELAAEKKKLLGS